MPPPGSAPRASLLARGPPGALPTAARALGLAVVALALSPVARGHLPHDKVVAVAAPAALDDSGPWLVIADPSSAQQLLRSDDGGYSWAFIGGPPLVDPLWDAARLDDGWIALLGEGRLWWTRQGDDWLVQDVPDGLRQLVAWGDELVLGGRAGVMVLGQGEDPLTELDVAVRHLAVGESGVLVVDEQDRIWLRQADGWSSLQPPAAGVISVAGGGGAVFAGTRSGMVWRHDGETWQPCGALPAEGGYPDVTRLAVGQEVVLAAPAGTGPWASFDGCATWEDRHGATVSYGGSGGADGADEAWSLLVAGERTWLIGGWAGLSRSNDAGGSWDEAALIPADYARGAAFSPTVAQDHAVWVGSYAGGVLRSLDAGASWTGPNLGLGAPNVQDVRVHPQDGRRLFAIAGHTAWSSVDGGLHWSAEAASLAYVASVLPGPEALWIQGRGSDDQPVLLRRAWGSAAWQELPASPVSGALGLVERDGVRQACASVSNQGLLTCVPATGGSWWTAYQGDAGPMTAVQQLPSGLWLLGSAGAVLRADPDGTGWAVELTLDDDVVAELAPTVDGLALLGTATGRLWVRDPDGAWSDLGLQLPAPPNRLVPRPDFDAHPQLMVATCAGVFLVDLDAPALTRFAPVHWVDDGSLEACPSCPEVAEVSASFSSLRELDGGADAVAADVVTKVRGERVAVRGRLDPGEELRVMVFAPDGAFQATAHVVGEEEGEGAPVRELLAVEGLDDGWHRVEVRGGAGAEVDVVVGSTAGATLPVQAWEAAAGCSWGADARSWWGLLLAAGAIIRRRGRRRGAGERVCTRRPPGARAVP